MIERTPLLTVEPHPGIESLEDLLGLANAIEVEAVARYDQLASLMEAQGESATAAVFREMCDIEQQHVRWVARLGESLQREVPPAAKFTWHMPPDIAESWDSVQHSTLLTPYRALAVAVTNEERAFVLYSYIAAQAEDAEVARQAESLAREELAHAAELRVRRRLAFRRAFPAGSRPASEKIETLDDFRALERRLAGEVAGALQGIAEALEHAGDAASARIVAGIATRESRLAAAGDTPQRHPPARGTQTVVLLQEALRPMEAASEIYEDLVAQAEQEDLLQAAQSALHRIVEGISLLGRRLTELGASAGEPSG